MSPYGVTISPDIDTFCKMYSCLSFATSALQRSLCPCEEKSFRNGNSCNYFYAENKNLFSRKYCRWTGFSLAALALAVSECFEIMFLGLYLGKLFLLIWMINKRIESVIQTNYTRQLKEDRES